MVGRIARLLLGAALGAIPALAWGQTRFEPKVDNPLTRSFYWFRYVGGTDIRERCAAGGLNHIRLVYNAVWGEQVGSNNETFNEQARSYDVALQGDGSATLVARVLSDFGNLARVDVRDVNGLLDPWRAKRAETRLAAADVARLTALLNESGGFGPPPAGLELPSNDYWWTVASCRNGRWGFAAYHYPTDKFARVRFAQAVFAADKTGVPVAAPKDLPPAIFRGDRARQWRLAVGREGLRDY